MGYAVRSSGAGGAVGAGLGTVLGAVIGAVVFGWLSGDMRATVGAVLGAGLGVLLGGIVRLPQSDAGLATVESDYRGQVGLGIHVTDPRRFEQVREAVRETDPIDVQAVPGDVTTVGEPQPSAPSSRGTTRPATGLATTRPARSHADPASTETLAGIGARGARPAPAAAAGPPGAVRRGGDRTVRRGRGRWAGTPGSSPAERTRAGPAADAAQPPWPALAAVLALGAALGAGHRRPPQPPLTGRAGGASGPHRRPLGPVSRKESLNISRPAFEVRPSMPAMAAASPLSDLPSGLRRALARADAGKTLDVDEATLLLGARGAALTALCATAARIRDAAHGDRITYSRKVFVPLTHLCRDTCGYCTFAWPPKGDVPAFLSAQQVLHIARAGAAAGCKEALFTLGDKPEERYPAAREWLEARGYATTLEYLRAVAITVIEETGLLPHLNPGVLTWTDLAALKPVSASMGLMLESASRRLLAKGGPHHNAPDKDPAARLRTLEDAGRSAVPFTSGILIGIGETDRERAEALFALRDVARRYGHLQEVIVQNFRAKPDTAMRHHPEPDADELLAAVAVARVLLPTRVHLQAPPNLSPDDVERIVGAGIDDWGGVSPVTPDHVNPERPWPHLDELGARTAATGHRLVERLCVHPEFVRRPDPWLSGRMRGPVLALADPEGLAVAGRSPRGIAWQDPDTLVGPTGDDQRWRDAVAGQGVTALQRDSALRDDAAAVYGDSELIAAHVLAGGPRRSREVTQRSAIRPEVAAVLRRAEAGTAPDEAETLLLFDTAGPELAALCAVADAVRAERVGDVVTYVVNRNINFTNICYTGCRFCAFAQRRDDPDAYFLSLEQVADRAEQAWQQGATEVCMQGGIHPDLGGEYYFELVRAVKERVPGIHVHAFSPMEVVNGATRLGVSVRDFLVRARDAGLGTIPGTAAEILDDEVRWVLTKGKLPADAWVDVVTAAHEVGLRSSATMMFGHVDEPRHWAAHLHLLRRLQRRNLDRGLAGFTEFVPLPFVHRQAPIYLAGLARPGPDFDDTVRVHAVARLALQGVIDNVQLSWVKVGLERAAALLRAGANDLGGTLMEETISRMAGADHGVRQDPETLREVARSAGRVPAERTTDYARVEPDGIRYLLRR